MSDNGRRIASIEVLRQLVTRIEGNFALYHVPESLDEETKSTIIHAIEFAIEHMEFYNIERKQTYDSSTITSLPIKRLIIEF